MIRHSFFSGATLGLLLVVTTLFARAETGGEVAEVLFQDGYTLYQQRYSLNAFAKFKEATQLGHVEAAYYAGNILRRNHICITEEAEAFYRQAAEGEDVYAMLRLAQKGNFCGTLRNCDYDRQEWLQRALNSVLPKAEAGDLEAMKETYSVYRVAGDKKKAWGWIQRAAEGGHAFSQYWVAILLEEQDMGFYWTEAGRRADMLKWLKASAEQGFPKAMFKLAVEYKEDGRFDQANGWVDRLGQTDYFDALYNYGLILLEGPKGMFKYPAAKPVEGLAVLMALHRQTGSAAVQRSIDKRLPSLTTEVVTEAEVLSRELLVDTPILHYLPKFGI
ncbi:tetratricopeptide repeat protein [Marinobacter sediminicola]|uniref:tetratricopeptide repeat protein n=1 Tax=Marinobacter sediminicola TaxID=3072994 RepID=UPI00281269D8|nr:hypothetical protein [Marinobacter sp. F26243]